MARHLFLYTASLRALYLSRPSSSVCTVESCICTLCERRTEATGLPFSYSTFPQSLSLQRPIVVFLIVAVVFTSATPLLITFVDAGAGLHFPSIVCCNFLFRGSFAGEKDVSLTLGRKKIFTNTLEERFAGHFPISPTPQRSDFL